MTATRQKTALITGCSSGIGLHSARALAKTGRWRVFAAARRAESVRALEAEGFAGVLQMDMDAPESIRGGLDSVLEKTGGRLDVLFNNAAYGQPGAVEDLGRDALRAQFETNVFGAQELTNAAVKIMRKNGGGRIIHNSSTLGYVCLKYRGAYNASKYALEALADTMRMELAGSGVRVILLEPGPIESDFRKNAAKAFDKNINAQESAHRNTYEKMRAAWERGDKIAFTLGPEAVYAAFLHAAESSSPKLRYRITVPAILFWYLKRALPVRWMDAVLSRV